MKFKLAGLPKPGRRRDWSAGSGFAPRRGSGVLDRVGAGDGPLASTGRGCPGGLPCQLPLRFPSSPLGSWESSA